MFFPLTVQDEFPFSGGYASFVNSTREDTHDVSHHAGYPSSTRYESGGSFYKKTDIMLPHVQISDSPSMAFAAPAQNATEDISGGRPTCLSAYAPSIYAPVMSTNTPIMAAAPPALNVAPQAPSSQVTTQRRFGCPMCPKRFERIIRAEACHNKHLDWRPHVCQGACGNTACNAAYGSIENLHRHVRPLPQRKVACTHCSRSILKQNVSRHEKFCSKSGSSKQELGRGA